MAKLALSFASLLALIPLAVAQSAEYGQCGGTGWTGATVLSNVQVEGFGMLTSYRHALMVGFALIAMPTTLNAFRTSSASSTTTSSTSTVSSSTSTTATSTTALPTGTSDAGLSNVAKAAGKKYFGSATDNPELTDAPYVAELSNTNDFTQITPDATEPEQGTWTFTEGDAIVTLAQSNGQLVRAGSPLELGPMKRSLQSFPTTAELLLVIMQEKYSWDVINEPFNDDGTWRSDVFYDTMGEYFVPVALNAARAADPKAKLYINDYNIEGTGAKSTAMVNLVQSLQAAGVPIDGVGIQGHLIVGEVPTTMVENMLQFTALGIEVAITELDIRMTLPETAALLEQQKSDYQTVIEACNSVPGCVGVTLWDYTDKYSWVPSTFSGQGAACPWDENLVKKPAYDGIVAGWTS
ncbi:hypothetical protein H0H92_003178 [Tricholoma furcatifolium]|nr:hypothetical protein H0H92_003178 [Tricholoma furcatifolium]